MGGHPFRTWESPSGLPIIHEVSTPRVHRTLSRLLLATGLWLLAVLTLTPWQQSADGEGRVIAFTPVERQQILEAPIDGRIVQWHVREGSIVKAGDPLVDIADNDPDLMNRIRGERDAIKQRIELAKQRVSTLEARISTLEEMRRTAVAAAAARVRVAAQRVKASEQALEASKAANYTSKLNLDRQRALVKDGLVSNRAVELAELEFTRTLTEVERSNAALLGARSEESAALSEKMRVDAERESVIEEARASLASAQADIARTNEELYRIEVRIARQEAQSVVANRDGMVQRVLVVDGNQMVKAGDKLLILVPDTKDRAVEVWVKGNDAPLISPMRHVRLQFEGWPALQFSGWPSVAIGTFGGRVAFVDPSDDGKGKFRVVIVPDEGEPWPDARYLRQGVRAHAWVLLDQVRLGYELWRQFNGFPPTVNQPVDGDEKDDKGKK
ncbi:MAG: biotin/lipoyl-binding protein [Myxococcales bacterium]|nr:HlyD family secretion protein [Polyangiaceae bacterium]MDW8248894.1 biotin/lipoyl-binding protein [Myxococcales bacterium]